MKICILPKFKPGEISGVAKHIEGLKRHLAGEVRFVDSWMEADLTVIEAMVDSPRVDVYINHGGFVPFVHPRVEQIVVQCLVAARKVISGGAKWTTEFYKDKYKIEPVIIPGGVDVEEFDEVPEGEFCARFGVKPGFFLWAKNVVDETRNPRDFVEMAKLMPDEQFVMTLHPQRQRPPLNMKVVGLLDWHWMKRALKDCGCLVSVSLDVFPFQMLEAWACSKPILGYAEGGIGEAVCHLKTGYIAKIGDLAGLTEGARYIVEHGEELGRNGRREVERKYQWKNVAQRFLRVFEDTLEEKRRENKKVTVTISCYNLKQYVARAIKSVLNQTYEDFELIVIDDGSMDGSSKVIQETIEGDHRARLIRQENRGSAPALNRGLEEGDGKYCMILAADDAIKPTYLERAVGILESDDRVGYVYSDMQVASPGRVQTIRCGRSNLELLKRINTHAYCYVFRRKFFERAGGYKDINPSYEDWEFNLHITKLGAKGYHIADPLFIYTQRDDGRTAKAQGYHDYLYSFIKGYHPDLFDPVLISVVIPCYNHNQFVEEAIESVVAQTWPHWEMVIVDDGSKKPVEPIIKPWLKAYPGKIRLVRQENLGLSEARNTGIREAKGEYIALLDADDKFMPDHLEKSLNKFLKADGAGYTYTDFRNFGAAGDSVVTMPEYDFNLLLRQCFHVSSLLFPKKIWEQAVEERGFGYDSKMRWGWEDWEWALWMGKRGHCGTRVADPTYFYRQHKFSMRKSLIDSHRKEMRSQLQQSHVELFRGGELPMGCCGGRRAPARANPGHNPGNPGNPNPSSLDYVVTYTGIRTAKMTKVGPSGTVYRFSADPRYQKQFVSARDIGVFQRDSQYAVELRGDLALPTEPEPEPPAAPPEPMKPLEDDLSRIRGVTKDRAETLRRLGVKSFNELALADPEDLALSLAVAPSTIKRWQTQGKKLLGGQS